MNRLIIDVRQPFEFAVGHYEGSVNIPPDEILQGSELLAKTPKDTEIIVYCLSGSRSNAVIQILKAQGFTNLVNGINKEQLRAKLG